MRLKGVKQMAGNIVSPPELSFISAGFVQFDVKLGETAQNLATVKQALTTMAPAAGSLIVLPELWAAGFDYPRIEEHSEHTTELLETLQSEASCYDIYLAGSLPEKKVEAGRVLIYNTLYIVGPEGVAGSIRKQQLFAPMAEDQYFTAGNNPQPIATQRGLLAGLICFDLRFPDLIRNQVARGAQLLVVSGQWPAARREHWRTLLKARAIENQVFVIGCNRCGSSDGIEFGGHSMIIAPDGTVLAEAGNGPNNATVPVDSKLFANSRKLFTAVGPKPYCFPDQDKIVSAPVLQGLRQNHRHLQRRVVFTSGCFDVLQPDHVRYLEKARRLGDCLVVGLPSDGSSLSRKVSQPPINDDRTRARIIAALGCVDHVVVFTEDTPLQLIRELLPDVLAVDANEPQEKIIGKGDVLAAGGQVLNISSDDNC